MNYKSSLTQQFETTELTGFTRMEAHCAETVEPLKVGDKVVVTFVATIVENDASNIPISIPLESPMIVKKAAYGAFSNRLLETFEGMKEVDMDGAAFDVEKSPQKPTSVTTT